MRVGRGWSRWRVGVGVLLSMIVFALLLRSLSAAEVLLALRRMHLGWFVPLFVLVALGEFTRALKWHVILAPIRRVAILRLYGAIMIGYLANLVVPLRVSPLVRAAVIRARAEVPTATVLATVAVDRLVDGVVSIGLLAGVLIGLPLPPALASVQTALATAGWMLFGLYLGILVVLAVVAKAPQAGGRIWLALGRPFPRRWREWVVRGGRRFARGLVLPVGWPGRGAVVLLALIQKVTQVWQIQITAWAFGVHVTAGTALFLVLFLGTVVLVAGALGISGGYYAAITVGLGWFGVRVDTGLAMGIVQGMTNLLTVALLGLLFLWREGMCLGGLRAWAQQPPNS